MKNFFTISEFAALRDVNINSLRYYERIGILVPAYTDPHTKYRYYSAEQLIRLDIIKLAVDLEVPLKELKKYGESGSEGNITMFEDSKALALEKIKEMETRLKRIDYTLHMFEDIKDYAPDRFYSRVIKERAMVAAEYGDSLKNVKKVSAATTDIINYAKKYNAPIVFPMGIMLLYGDGITRQYVCFHTAAPCEGKDGIISFTVPERTFTCIKTHADVGETKDDAEKLFGDIPQKLVLAFVVQGGGKSGTTTELQCLPL